MPSVLDEAVIQALNTGMAKEAAAGSDSRSRAWDGVFIALGVASANYTTSPSIIAAQATRYYSGTPTTSPLQAPNTQAPPAG